MKIDANIGDKIGAKLAYKTQIKLFPVFIDSSNFVFEK